MTNKELRDSWPASLRLGLQILWANSPGLVRARWRRTVSPKSLSSIRKDLPSLVISGTQTIDGTPRDIPDVLERQLDIWVSNFVYANVHDILELVKSTYSIDISTRMDGGVFIFGRSGTAHLYIFLDKEMDRGFNPKRFYIDLAKLSNLPPK